MDQHAGKSLKTKQGGWQADNTYAQNQIQQETLFRQLLLSSADRLPAKENCRTIKQHIIELQKRFRHAKGLQAFGNDKDGSYDLDSLFFNRVLIEDVDKPSGHDR